MQLQCRRPWLDSWIRNVRWRRHWLPSPVFLGFPCGSAGKESTWNADDLGSLSGLERSPGEGKGYLLQYYGLENSMDCIAYGVAKSRTQISDFHFASELTKQAQVFFFVWLLGVFFFFFPWRLHKQCLTEIVPNHNFYSKSYDFLHSLWNTNELLLSLSSSLVVLLLSSSLEVQLVKNLPAMQKTLVWFLGWKELLEKGRATHSSVLGLPWWLSW